MKVNLREHDGAFLMVVLAANGQELAVGHITDLEATLVPWTPGGSVGGPQHMTFAFAGTTAEAHWGVRHFAKSPVANSEMGESLCGVGRARAARLPAGVIWASAVTTNPSKNYKAVTCEKCRKILARQQVVAA
jgi:hypothetical protein